MPTTERDAQALTYLARRIREETPGASKWDEPGVHAVISELVGQNLAITAERVIRHAGDPQAKTPGAIRRPFLPDAPTLRRELDVAPVRTRCTTCGARTPAECTPDHEFTQWRPRDVDVTPVVAELKDHMRPPTAPADPHPPQERTVTT